MESAREAVNAVCKRTALSMVFCVVELFEFHRPHRKMSHEQRIDEEGFTSH
jgi:hypothetical protein